MNKIIFERFNSVLIELYSSGQDEAYKELKKMENLLQSNKHEDQKLAAETIIAMCHPKVLPDLLVKSVSQKEWNKDLEMLRRSLRKWQKRHLE